MALLIRAFQFFSSLGAIATTPFAVKFASKQEIARLRGGRLASYREVIAQQEVIPPKEEKELKPTEVVNVAQQMMDSESGKSGGEKRCFWWPTTGGARGWEWLACVYMNELNRLFLFHYDRNNQLGLNTKLNPVTELTYSEAGITKMQLKENQSVEMTRQTKLIFAWLRKWGVEFLPGKHCTITKNDNKNDYTLTCDNTSKKPEGRPFNNPNINLESLHSNRYQSQTQ